MIVSVATWTALYSPTSSTFYILVSFFIAIFRPYDVWYEQANAILVPSATIDGVICPELTPEV